MDAGALRVLRVGAARFHITLGANEERAFDSYLALLNRWNERINLTRIEGDEAVVTKHFLDSLAVVPHIDGVRTLVDVGSGAGFPGAVVAIVRPDVAVTLVESIAKKTAFLESLKRTLHLPLTILTKRVESLIADGQCFDAAVSRATFAPREWLRLGARLVPRGGRVIAMLGREPLETPEHDVARFAYQLPGADDRQILVWRSPADGAGLEGVPTDTLDTPTPRRA